MITRIIDMLSDDYHIVDSAPIIADGDIQVLIDFGAFAEVEGLRYHKYVVAVYGLPHVLDRIGDYMKLQAAATDIDNKMRQEYVYTNSRSGMDSGWRVIELEYLDPASTTW